MFCSRSPMPRCVCFIRKFHIVAVSRLLLPPHIRHHVLSPSKRTEENSKNRKIFDSSRRKHLIKVGLMLSHKMSNQELNGVFFLVIGERLHERIYFQFASIMSSVFEGSEKRFAIQI